jgi:hypothetical protein
MSRPPVSFKSWIYDQPQKILMIKYISDQGQEFGFAYSCSERGPLSSTVLVALNVQAPHGCTAVSAVCHMMNYIHYHAARGNAIADGQVWSSDDCECPPQPQFNFMLIEATKDQVALLTDERERIVMYRSDDFTRNLRKKTRSEHRILVLVPMKQSEAAENYDQLRAIAADMIQTSAVSERALKKGLFGTADGGGLKRRVASPRKCSNPGCTEDGANICMKLMLCSACHQIRYCSRECQAQHWPVHKLACMKCAGCSGGGKCVAMGD